MTITCPAPRPSTHASTPDPRPTRDVLADLLVSALGRDVPAAGARAAWQGPDGALETWRRAHGPDDLDIWADDAGADLLDALIRAVPAGRVQHTDDPRRLRHTSYAVETPTGVAVIDVTRGDLMVGPVRLLATDAITVADGRLTATAAAADRLVRPLLRGKVPPADRVDQARSAWRSADEQVRSDFARALERQLGTVAQAVVAALDSDLPVDSSLAVATRRALARVTMRPRNLGAAWAQRRVVVPAGKHAGPLGLRMRGALVVLVGTDGSGKSTVADEIAVRLQALGISTTTAHLGMARGNLPGVGLARRLLGVAPAGDSAPDPTPTLVDDAATDPLAETSPEDHSAGDDGPTSLSHPTLRRAAAWFYAAEYGVRWLRDVRPGMRHGGVVIADRYVYDLRESPWPGSRASRAAERTLRGPDVLVLPDAPAEQIHARKPERPLREQRDQQERFRALLSERPARVAEVVVDTSGAATADDVARVVAAVLEALHTH